MMHVIISERLYDADYVRQYTVGFENLREKVEQYSPERVAHWTGIAADDVRKLAREYATVRPSVIRLNYGVQRLNVEVWQLGSSRCCPASPALGRRWEAAFSYRPVLVPLSTPGIETRNLMKAALGRDARTINMVQLGQVLNTASDPPVKALFVYGSNPAAVCPNHDEVVRGLVRPDLFTVVHEQFFTDTCDYADIVLPATTFFEHKDLQKAYGHYYLAGVKPSYCAAWRVSFKCRAVPSFGSAHGF